MSWVHEKLERALILYDKYRKVMTLDEFIELLGAGHYILRPEGYSKEWLKEELLKADSLERITYGEIQGIIADTMFISLGEVRPTSLLKDLGAESVDILDIIFRVEKLFEIEFPKKDINELLNYSTQRFYDEVRKIYELS